MNPIVLIPVYQPGPPLQRLLDDLLRDDRDPTAVVIVDDGSGPSADRLLAAASDLGCTVLRCPDNKGKGVALKRGFHHVAVHHPGVDVVTADGDGQHRAVDIRAVAERTGRGTLVLGARPFDQMPLRSRVGNVVTDLLFRGVTGRAVADTQTGLRGYPADLLGRMCTLPGEHFEFEMNVLLAVTAAGVPIDEVPIPATYLNGNAASNFGGLTDSVRVLRSLVLHATIRPARLSVGPESSPRR